MFIYLFWERASTEERQRVREKENPKQALHCQHRAQRGAQAHKPWDYDLSQNQVLDAQPTEPPRCPGTLYLKPPLLYYVCIICSLILHYNITYQSVIQHMIHYIWTSSNGIQLLKYSKYCIRKLFHSLVLRSEWTETLWGGCLSAEAEIQTVSQRSLNPSVGCLLAVSESILRTYNTNHHTNNAIITGQFLSTYCVMKDYSQHIASAPGVHTTSWERTQPKQNDPAWKDPAVREQNHQKAEEVGFQRKGFCCRAAKTHIATLPSSKLLPVATQPRLPNQKAFLIVKKILPGHLKCASRGAPEQPSQLSTRIQLRSRSHSSRVWAPRRALCWQLRAWSLLQIRVSLALCPSPTHALSLKK